MLCHSSALNCVAESNSCRLRPAASLAGSVFELTLANQFGGGYSAQALPKSVIIIKLRLKADYDLTSAS